MYPHVHDLAVTFVGNAYINT